MIGLGSNRLTVCRRGGMSVTQAGRGGMEWLAGGRMPSWANPYLPYSKAAGEALKAQFPTQWPTIRDYGVAHPEIVGYMNAYAPEDAKIAYSLVEGIGWRKAYNNGTGYFDTDIPTRGDIKITLVTERCAEIKQHNTYYSLFGSTNERYLELGAYNYNAGGQDAKGLIWAKDNSNNHLWLSGPYSGDIFTAELTRTGNDISAVVTMDGVIKSQDASTTSFTASANGRLRIGKGYYFGIIANAPISCKVEKNNSVQAWFIPFKRNGQMELLDLVSGNLATRVGTFTELIESPS